jgi:hypothetical protein
MAAAGLGRGFRQQSLLLVVALLIVSLSCVNLFRVQRLVNRLEVAATVQTKECDGARCPSSPRLLERPRATRQDVEESIRGILPEIEAAKEEETTEHPRDHHRIDHAGDRTRPRRPVHFLQKRHLDMPHDAFSATFWQAKARFLQVNLTMVRSVEGAIFEQLRDRRSGTVVRLHHQIRATADWLDFSVEHLSKWWRTLDYDRGPSPIAYHAIVTKLLAYLQRMPALRASVAPGDAEATAMRTTVAVIAFMPYPSPFHPEWGDMLTVVNLAATLASLTRHGIGRIVVVSEDAHHHAQALVQAAFGLVPLATTDPSALEDWEITIPLLIRREEDRTLENPRVDFQIDETSVAFANVNVTYSWPIEGTNQTNHMTLVPKAALESLQLALQGESKNPELWLGPGKTTQDYDYVYLTEPDTILQLRPSAMARIQHEMDQGNFLIPHRFQPAPHETDVMGYKDNRNWIPNYGVMSNLTSLDSRTDACCDDGMHRPKDDFPRCNSNWWACGYTQDTDWSAARRVEEHKRVHPYALIRIAGTGTELVLHAATNHGRRCIPRTNSVCGDPDDK